MYKSFKIVADTVSDTILNIGISLTKGLARPTRNIQNNTYLKKVSSNSNGIRDDYKKIGKDLFRSLNNYERSKGYEITTK